MHLHYMEYLDAVDERTFQHLIQDWISANRPYGPGYWRDSWNSYSVSLRSVVWMQEAARRGISTQARSNQALTASLQTQLHFLRSHLELDLGGNHLIKNIRALLWGSQCFEGEEAQAWRASAAQLLERELAVQILPDGVHFERSPSYHLQVWGDLLECYHVLEPSPLKERLCELLPRIGQAGLELTHPDGCPSQFSDGGLHTARASSACLSAAEQLGLDTPSARDLFDLPDAGYFGVRKGADLFIADVGPIAPDNLPAHGHGDIFAFEWTLGGRRMIVDTGVFEYQEGPRRAWSRGSLAHNTLTLDGQDQGHFWKSFRLGRRPHVCRLAHEPFEGGAFLQAEHDGFSKMAGAPVHRRSFRATHRHISVRDEVAGGAGQRAEARILLHPDCHIEREGGGWIISNGITRARLNTTASVTLRPAPYWPDFGVEQEATQVTLDYGAAPCTGGFELEAL